MRAARSRTSCLPDLAEHNVIDLVGRELGQVATVDPFLRVEPGTVSDRLHEDYRRYVHAGITSQQRDRRLVLHLLRRRP